MKHSRHVALHFVLIALLTYAAVATSAQKAPTKPRPPLTRIGKLANVTVSGGDTPLGMTPAQTLRWESFTKVWQTLEDTYFDRTFNGLDWIKIKAEYRPRVVAAKTDADLYVILNEMIQRLGRSHFAIMPPEYLNTLKLAKKKSRLRERKLSGSEVASVDEAELDAAEDELLEDGTIRYGVGLDMRLINDRFVVTYIESGSAAQKAGIQPGFIVDKINGISISAIVDSYVASFPNLKNVRRYLPIQISSWFLNGEKDSPVTVTCLDSTDQSKDFTMMRQRLLGEAVSLGTNFPAQFVRYESRSISDDVGYIKFNLFSFDMIDKVCNSLTEFRTKKALIVDLRGNLGGLIASLIGVSGMFTDRPIELGTTITRYSTQPLAITPKKKRFVGRVVFLVDNQTASAAELFAAGMLENDRALVVGSTTAGEALPASAIQLATGATFLYPIANFRTKKGVFLEGTGLIPNFAVALERSSLLAGKDPQLERALTLINDNRDFRTPADPSYGGPPPPPSPAKSPSRQPPVPVGKEAVITAIPTIPVKLSTLKEAKALAVIADFSAIVGRGALKDLKTYDAIGDGTLNMEASKVAVKYRVMREMPDKYAFTITTPASGDVREIHNGAVAVVESDFGYDQDLPSIMDAERSDIFRPISFVADGSRFDSLKYLGAFDRLGRKCHIVEGRIGQAIVAMAFDVESKLLVSYAGNGSVSMGFGDYRKTGEVTLPFKVEVEGLYELQFSRITVNTPIDESNFKKKEKCFDKHL